MKFAVGDIICSSLSSAQEVVEIREGTLKDFAGRYVDFTGEMCYVLQYVGGARMIFVYSTECIDKDHHLKGSPMFEAYESARRA
jgi:hypothetical protein